MAGYVCISGSSSKQEALKSSINHNKHPTTSTTLIPECGKSQIVAIPFDFIGVFFVDKLCRSVGKNQDFFDVAQVARKRGQ